MPRQSTTLIKPLEDGASQVSAAVTYPLYFPAAAEDLPYGHFWYYSRAHSGTAVANDFTGIRYDQSVEKWNADTTSKTNEETVIWSVPVRAAADGEVIAGWRGFPDGVNGVNPYDDTVQTKGGNYLVIRTDDDHIVFYAHLRQNSIPAELLPNSVGETPKNVKAKTGSFPTEYLVPAGQRKRVRTGQYLGQVGHSGNSTGPHLHMHVQKIEETQPGVFTLKETVPARFYGASKVQGFSHGNISENWSALNGHVLNDILPDGTIAILPEAGRRPGLSARAANRLDVVARDEHRHLLFKYWNGEEWSDWKNLGGTLTSNPTCASWSSERVDCFGRGTNMRLHHKYWTTSGGWSDWNEQPGLLTSAPAVVARDDQKLDVFARGRDFGLWHKAWSDSAWSDWQSLGGHLSSAPACTSWSKDRIDCVARGRNNNLWHIYWDGQTWSDWSELGGALTSGPTIASRGYNRLDIFARGQNNHLWMKQWNGTWSDWSDLGGVLMAGPSAVSWNSSRIDVQAVGQNGNLWHLYWTPSGWSSWKDLGDFE
ncbi:MAG: hypothetical protein AAF716_18925 [Cyanobacteria bacterium P01_D01_bin.1]